MAYKFTKGSQVIGDLKAADDAERNTLIDFGEDQIEFQTSGSTRLKVHNAGLDVTGTIHVSSSNSSELLRLAKTGADSREIVFELDGSDRFEIAYNSFENVMFSTLDSGDDIYFRLNGVNSLAMLRSPSRIVKVYDSLSQYNNFEVYASSSFKQPTTFEAPISFEDVIMAELSIPGLDLQTDTNAYTFTCPYNLELTELGLTVDQHTTSGNITVEVTNPDDGTLITATIPGTDDFVQVTTVTSGSRSQGDSITFEITATPANAQGLRANLYFKRTV